jgi:large subunit ribosomal protein L14e
MHERHPKRESKVGKMIEIGRLCIKTAGRDAGLKCVVTEIIDNTYVKIDGQTRARKCNIWHLEPLNQIVELKKNPGHDEIIKALKKQGIEIAERKEKGREKPKAEKPVKPSKKRDKNASEPKKAKDADKQPKKAKK